MTRSRTNTGRERYHSRDANRRRNNHRKLVLEMLERRNMLAAEIDVLGNGVSIPDGDTSPRTTDHTDFGSVDVSGGTMPRTFTIKNTGTAQLGLSGTPLVQVTGVNAAEFVVTAQPTINRLSTNGGSTTFQVTFNPSGYGLRTATISIPNSDANENPYDFRIQGTGYVPAPGAPGTPDLIWSDDSGYDRYDDITRTLTSLRITWTAGANAERYYYGWDNATPSTWTTSLGASIDAPAGTSWHTFYVRSWNVGGGYSTTTSQLNVYIDWDGPKLNAPVLASDDDSGYYNNDKLTRETSLRFDWSTSGSLVRQFRYGWDPANLTSATTNTFATVAPPFPNGTFRFYVQAEAMSGFPEDPKSIEVRVDTTGPTVAKPRAPTGTVASLEPLIDWDNVYDPGMHWKFLVDLEYNDGSQMKAPGFDRPLERVRMDSTWVPAPLDYATGYRVRIAAYDLAGNVGPFSDWQDFNTLGMPQPDMEVLGKGIVIVSGAGIPNANDGTDFGGVEVSGGLQAATFTINNLGPGDLSLTGTESLVTVSGMNASDFRLAAPGPVTPVEALNGTTSFEIEFNPSSIGLRTAVISIPNSDPDENPYTFTIQGQGVNINPSFNCGPVVLAQAPFGMVHGPVRAVTITFGELIDEKTFSRESVMVTRDGQPIPITVVANRGSNDHRIEFSEPLVSPGSYEIVVRPTVTDRAGNQMNQHSMQDPNDEVNGEDRDTYLGSFTIFDSGPYVVGMTPNANSVARTAPDYVDLTFSEPLLISTLEPNVTIYRDEIAIPFGNTTPENVGGNTFRFHFAPQTAGRFRIVVDVGVTDLLGNGLNQNRQDTFQNGQPDDGYNAIFVFQTTPPPTSLPKEIAFRPIAKLWWHTRPTTDGERIPDEQSRSADWTEQYIRDHEAVAEDWSRFNGLTPFRELVQAEAEELANDFETFHTSGLSALTLQHDYQFGFTVEDVVPAGTLVSETQLSNTARSVVNTFLKEESNLLTFEALNGESAPILTHRLGSDLSLVAHDSDSFQAFLDQSLKPIFLSSVSEIAHNVSLEQFGTTVEESLNIDDAVNEVWTNRAPFDVLSENLGRRIFWDAGDDRHPVILQRLFGGTQGFEIDLVEFNVDAQMHTYNAKLVVRILDTFGVDFDDCCNSHTTRIIDSWVADGNLSGQWMLQHLSLGGRPFIQQVEIPVVILNEPIVTASQASANAILDASDSSGATDGVFLLPGNERLVSIVGLTADAQFTILDSSGAVVVDRDCRSAFGGDFGSQASSWLAEPGQGYVLQTEGVPQQLSITNTLIGAQDVVDTATYMLGIVRTNVVLLESPGDATTIWSGSEIEAVKNSVAEGGAFWEQAREQFSGRSDLYFEFSFDFADAPLPVPSALFQGADVDLGLFVDSLRETAGFVVSDDDSLADRLRDVSLFNHQQRVSSGSDFATTVFFLKKGFAGAPTSWAQLGGPWAVITGEAATTPQIFAHELGNVFYALDEYAGSDSVSDTSGYLRATNLNASDGNSDAGQQVPSIMLDPFAAWEGRDVSPSAAAMVGWRDEDGDGIDDVLDVPLLLIGGGEYDVVANSFRFAAMSFAEALPNLNPNPFSTEPVTLNTVDRVQYRLGEGEWITKASYGTTSADIEFDIENLPAGTHTIDVRTIDDDTGVVSNIISHEIGVTVVVAEFQASSSEFRLRLNSFFEFAQLNLYDGHDANFNVPDVVVLDGDGEVVTGSVLLDADGRGFTFHMTGAPWEPGTYTVTLRSAEDAIRDTGGRLLDGNFDGSAGGDYVMPFVVEPRLAETVVLSIGELARGPGQEIREPDTSGGLTIFLSNAHNVDSVSFKLRYDAALMEITDVVPGADVPVDSTIVRDFGHPGELTVTFTSPTPLTGSDLRLLDLVARVPDDAPYHAKHLLDLTDIQVQAGAVPAIDDDGLHVVVFVGDSTGDGWEYEALDAQRVQRVEVGLDTGFSAYPLVDPVIIADVVRDGYLDALDAVRILQESVGIDRPEIPRLPDVLPDSPATGPDPAVYLVAAPSVWAGGTIDVPVQFERLPGDEEVNFDLVAIGLRIQFPNRLITAESADVLPGSITSGAGWSFVQHVSDLGNGLGEVRISASRLAGVNPDNGTLAVVRFHVQADASGAIAVDLRGAGTVLRNNDGQALLLNPAPQNGLDAGDVQFVAWETQGNPWTNPVHPCDVNGDTEITPLDVLLLIQELNKTGQRSLVVTPGMTPPMWFLDPTGDGLLAPMDVLTVINHLNQFGPGTALSAEGEGGFAQFGLAMTAEQANKFWQPLLPRPLAVPSQIYGVSGNVPASTAAATHFGSGDAPTNVLSQAVMNTDTRSSQWQAAVRPRRYAGLARGRLTDSVMATGSLGLSGELDAAIADIAEDIDMAWIGPAA